MEAKYAEIYEALYTRHWWWRAREKMLHSLLSRKTTLLNLPNPRILDIGCGDGWFLRSLPKPFYKLGLEKVRSLVSTESLSSGLVRVGGFEALSGLEGSFNLVSVLDVIEHVEEDEEFLRKASSFLLDRGYLLITVPAYKLLWTKHDVQNQHLRRYNRKMLLSLVSKLNLRVVHLQNAFAFSACIKLVLHFIEPYLKNKENLSTSFLPGPASYLMGRIALLEFYAQSSLPKFFPFGSSLFMICRVERS